MKVFDNNNEKQDNANQNNVEKQDVEQILARSAEPRYYECDEGEYDEEEMERRYVEEATVKNALLKETLINALRKHDIEPENVTCDKIEFHYENVHFEVGLYGTLASFWCASWLVVPADYEKLPLLKYCVNMQNQMPWSPTFSFYEAPRENQVEFYTRCELAIHPCIPDVDDLIYEVIMQSIRSQDNMLNNCDIDRDCDYRR